MSIYKGNKLVAGGSVDTHFVRRPAWDQAVAISVSDLTAGYKAPADGMIVGACYDSVGGENYYLTLNGTYLMPLLSIANTNIARPLTLSLTVNKGDIVSCTAPSANIVVLPSVKFVPFEDSTVSDVEVVTPEYIRNQNILSDWEDITISTSSSSPTVMPYDGFIYSFTSHNVELYINTTPFIISNHNTISGNGACMIAVRKGDRVYINSDSESTERVAYYKLRDYTGR